MLKSQPVLALDIGSTKIACVIGKPYPVSVGTWDGVSKAPAIEMLGWATSNYPALSATWPCDIPLIAKTLEQVLDDTKATHIPTRAVVTFSHPELSHARVTAQIDVSDEPITIRARDVQRLKAQAVSQSLGLDRELLRLESLGYAGNGFKGARDPRGLVATRLSGVFQLTSVPRSVKRSIAQALEIAGLELDRVAYSLQAVAASCAEEPRPSARTLLIDLGGCNTDVAILDRGVLVSTSSMPWGGMTIAQMIGKECRLTLEQALTASLEGLASPRAAVRQAVEHHLRLLQRHLHQLFKDESLPELALVTGRGALIDGLVEKIGQMLEIKTVLGRSRRAQRFGELATQMAFTAALGALELACPPAIPIRPMPSRFIDRLLDRTKTILTEYF